MTQRAIAFAIIGLLAIIALEHSGEPKPLPLVHADYERCITIAPPPLQKARGVPLNPRQSELS